MIDFTLPMLVGVLPVDAVSAVVPYPTLDVGTAPDGGYTPPPKPK